MLTTKWFKSCKPELVLGSHTWLAPHWSLQLPWAASTIHAAAYSVQGARPATNHHRTQYLSRLSIGMNVDLRLLLNTISSLVPQLALEFSIALDVRPSRLALPFMIKSCINLNSSGIVALRVEQFRHYRNTLVTEKVHMPTFKSTHVACGSKL